MMSVSHGLTHSIKNAIVIINASCTMYCWARLSEQHHSLFAAEAGTITAAETTAAVTDAGATAVYGQLCKCYNRPHIVFAISSCQSLQVAVLFLLRDSVSYLLHFNGFDFQLG
jgi:hypothetical protein